MRDVNHFVPIVKCLKTFLCSPQGVSEGVSEGVTIDPEEKSRSTCIKKDIDYGSPISILEKPMRGYAKFISSYSIDFQLFMLIFVGAGLDTAKVFSGKSLEAAPVRKRINYLPQRREVFTTEDTGEDRIGNYV